MLFSTALGVFIVLTLIALFQPTGSPGSHHRAWTDPVRWIAPIELNHEAHLTAVGNTTIRAITSVPGTSHVWAAGDGGLILHSADGGWSWERQNPPPSQTAPVARSSPATVYAAELPPVKGKEPDPKVQQQSPAQNAEPEASKYPNTDPPRDPRTRLLPPFSELRKPGAAHRAPQAPAALAKAPPLATLGDDLIAVHFATPLQGWAASRYGAMLTTADGGRSWSFQTENRGSDTVQHHIRWARLDGLWFTGDPSWWSVIRRSGKVSPLAAAPTSPPLALNRCLQHLSDVPDNQHWCSPADPATAWYVGSDNKTLQRNTAVAPILTTPAAIRAIYFDPAGRTGWVGGDGGFLLHTSDGGLSWAPQTRPAGSPPVKPFRLPAPWYYALTFPLMGLLVWRASRPLPPRIAVEHIESSADSDKPLDEASPDAMNFRRIARALSRFIRNENTLPPLTISIDGEWGSGKSSMMNLLRCDLQRFGFRPVWFNAWHHQQEEHLLAALLGSIREHTTPPLWHPSNWVFRWRLLQIRGARHWVPLGLLAGLIAFLFAIPGQSTGVVAGMIDLVKSIPEGKPEQFFGKLVGGVPQLAFLATAVSTFLALSKGLTAFGVSPGRLLTSVSTGASVRNLQAQAGFRQRFSREFSDVTEALGPRSLIIFIDDLDRCKPDHVMTVLESINFLVSSGGCFVVIGMARQIVEKSVGLHFAAVAEEMADDGVSAPTPEQKKRQRTDFARQYLDKLINIEVPLPKPTLDQSTAILLNSRFAAEPEEKAPLVDWLRLVRLAQIPLLVASCVLGGLWLASMVPPPSPAAPTPTAVVASVPQATTTAAAGPSALVAGDSDLYNVPLSPVPVVNPGSQTAAALLGWAILVLGGIMLGSIAFWKLSEPDGLVVKDTPEFEKACRIWAPVLTAYKNTPRTVKRFRNRVRYLAMFQRPSDGDPGGPQVGLREASIVALGTMRYVGASDPETGPFAPVLKQALGQHQQAFGAMPSLDEAKAFDSIL